MKCVIFMRIHWEHEVACMLACMEVEVRRTLYRGKQKDEMNGWKIPLIRRESWHSAL